MLNTNLIVSLFSLSSKAVSSFIRRYDKSCCKSAPHSVIDDGLEKGTLLL